MDLIKLIDENSIEKYRQYLSDESRLEGTAQSISFPQTEEEILEILSILRISNTPVTIQGSRTGIVGAAVPTKGHILNLSKMNKVIEIIKTASKDFEGFEEFYIKVQPAITLAELTTEIKKIKSPYELFCPIDVTETSATIGGIISCNGQGICSYKYGQCGQYLESLRVVHADGTAEEISGDKKYIYLGGEGMFGIITELTLKLKRKPAYIYAVSFFFDSLQDACDFVGDIEKDETELIACIEYLDRTSLDNIEDIKEFSTKLKSLPIVDSSAEAMIYLEIHAFEEDDILLKVEKLSELAEKYNCDTDKSWMAITERDIEKMRTFRHAAAEAANTLIEKTRQTDNRITKLATDLTLPNADLKKLLAKYETDLKNSNLRASIFGHIGNKHLHVNLLPDNYEEYLKGGQLIKKWSKEAVEENGKLITEHGVGKLKKELFLNTAPKEYLEKIKNQKKEYDQIATFNPGNMI